MQMLQRDPWPFLPLQIRMTCSVVNEGKEIHLNLPEDFIGQKLTVSRSETVGLWNLHIGTEGFEVQAGKDKTGFCRIPAGAFPELKLKTFAQAYYDGERRGSRIHCGKMFDFLAYRPQEVKRDELTNAERTRRYEAATAPKQRTLRLASFKDLPSAIEQKKEEQKPMIALYPVVISANSNGDTLRFILPEAFEGKRFVLRGEIGNRWLEEADDGVIAKGNKASDTDNVYFGLAAKKNGLVLKHNHRSRFTCQWTGTRLNLGDAVEQFIAPAQQPSLLTTPVVVTKEATIGLPADRLTHGNVALAPQAEEMPRLSDDEIEIIELKEALASVNRIAKKRNMEVIIKDDGSIGLKMVVVSEF